MFDVKKFEELYLEPTRNGLTRPSKDRGKGLKMINMGEMFAYSRINNPPMELVQVSEKEYNNFSIQKGDLIFARQSLIAEGAGKCSIVIDAPEPTVFESHLIRLRLDKSKADPNYYYYFFSSEIGRGMVQGMVMEVAASGIRGSDLAKLKVLYPPLPTQQRIASILSAYDELIEVNNQRIKLLEETARELYKEWFVRMRFPGYKQAKFVKGVPEGWEIKKVKDIVDRRKFGRTYKPEALSEQGKVIVIDQSTDELLGYHDNEPDHIASSLNPMIIFGDHSCKMQLMVEPFSLAENVIPVSSKDQIPIFFLYYLIESLVETTEYKRHWNDLVTKSVLVCQPDIQKKYAEIVKPFFEQIDVLKKQNIQLRQIHARLLPRLISGKLEVMTEEVLLNSETETKYN